MKKCKYTQRDFKIARLIAIFFTAQFMFFYCAPLLARLPHSVVLPETIDKWFSDMIVYAVFWQFMLPVLIILSWYMCIERYLYLEFTASTKGENPKSRRNTYISIARMVALGIAFGFHVAETLDYVRDNWNLVNNLHLCIALRAMVALGWLLCWIYCIYNHKAFCVKGTGKKDVVVGIVIVVLLFLVTDKVNSYANWEADKYWYRMLDAHYEQCGPYADYFPARN